MSKTKLMVLLFMLSLMACKQENVKAKYLNHQTNTTVTEEWYPYSSLLLGEWVEYCVIYGDGTILMRNSCPHWKFSSNSILDINGDIKNWYVKKNALYLSPLPANRDLQEKGISRYLITKLKEREPGSDMTLELENIELGITLQLVKQQPYLHLSLPALNKK